MAGKQANASNDPELHVSLSCCFHVAALPLADSPHAVQAAAAPGSVNSWEASDVVRLNSASVKVLKRGRGGG